MLSGRMSSCLDLFGSFFLSLWWQKNSSLQDKNLPPYWERANNGRFGESIYIREQSSHTALSQLWAITVFIVAPKRDGSIYHRFILDDSKVQERFWIHPSDWLVMELISTQWANKQEISRQHMNKIPHMHFHTNTDCTFCSFTTFLQHWISGTKLLCYQFHHEVAWQV